MNKIYTKLRHSLASVYEITVELA